MPWSKRSLTNLQFVHPDLRRVLDAAVADVVAETGLDLLITEGRRTPQRQRELYAAGASRTLDSEHLPDDAGRSHAVDIAALIPIGGKWTVSWKVGLYGRLAAHIKAHAQRLGIPITWGGDWRGFRDLVHFELDKKHYPRTSYPRA